MLDREIDQFDSGFKVAMGKFNVRVWMRKYLGVEVLNWKVDDIGSRD